MTWRALLTVIAVVVVWVVGVWLVNRHFDE